MRSALSILISSLRAQAALTEAYFTAKAQGTDELSLRRLQVCLVDGAAAARQTADGAETLERAALAAVEDRLAEARTPSSIANSNHPDPFPPAA